MLQRIRISVIRWIIAQFEVFLFERKVASFYRQIFKRNPLTVLDIGANRGQTIDFFLNLNPDSTIYSFEPNPSLFAILKENYSQNNIHLFQKGVSNIEEKKTFYENILDESSTFEELNQNSEYLKLKSSILGVKPKDIIKKSYEVDVTTLNQFLMESSLKTVNVLKIDTEGHEFECLEGLFMSPYDAKIDIIQFEMHFDDMYLRARTYNEMKELLNQNGYKEIKKIKHGFGDFYDYFYSKSCEYEI